MRKSRFLIFLIAVAFWRASAGHAQDSPSLGDVARQARLQKQQKAAQAKDASSKNAQGNDAQGSDASSKDAQAEKPLHVITNDEIPSHVESSVTSRGAPQIPRTNYAQPSYESQTMPAEQWRSVIQAQKNMIASLEHEIANLSDSIQYAGGNCVANCVQWNERQKEKQDRVGRMKEQLEQQQKRLEDLQDGARKQGFGSSVYDP